MMQCTKLGVAMLLLRLSLLVVACWPALSGPPPRPEFSAPMFFQVGALHEPGRKQLSADSADGLGLLSTWEPWPEDQKMKVVYGVFTSPLPKYAEQMAAVADTWAKDVPPQKLLVVGVNGTAPGVTYKKAPKCKDGHVTNTGISCKEATLLTTGYELGADWVVVVGSDNYVFPRHMEERLARENAADPQILAIFGCGAGEYCEDHKGGLCGGGGYAISRGALDKMVGQAPKASHNFIQESMDTAKSVCGYWSDQVTSCIARRRGVKEVQLEGLYAWQLCSPGVWACDFNPSIYRNKMLSSSPKALTFHYITPDVMRTIHKMAKEVEKDVQKMGGRGALSKVGDQIEAEESDAGKVKSEHVHLNLLSTSTADDNYEMHRAFYVQMWNEASWAKEMGATFLEEFDEELRKAFAEVTSQVSDM